MPPNTLKDGGAGAVEPAMRLWRPAGGEAGAQAAARPGAAPEIGGRRDGTDPTRFGDWEKQGRCIDF